MREENKLLREAIVNHSRVQEDVFQVFLVAWKLKLGHRPGNSLSTWPGKQQ